MVTLQRGWAKAVARPWNRATGHGALRLIRGNASFLADAAEWTATSANGVVLSPALYPSATRIWKRVGFHKDLELIIMERQLGGVADPTSMAIEAADDPDMGELERLDRLAFDEFWHMEAAALTEARGATPRAQVLIVEEDDRLVGYSIVGAQLGTSFLQRIAVDPARQGRGIGTDLLRASFSWARKTGAANMLLNVREENEQARSLYRRHGFTETRNRLCVLRYGS